MLLPMWVGNLRLQDGTAAIIDQSSRDDDPLTPTNHLRRYEAAILAALDPGLQTASLKSPISTVDSSTGSPTSEIPAKNLASNDSVDFSPPFEENIEWERVA